jgi:hypothetical protein
MDLADIILSLLVRLSRTADIRYTISLVSEAFPPSGSQKTECEPIKCANDSCILLIYRRRKQWVSIKIMTASPTEGHAESRNLQALKAPPNAGVGSEYIVLLLDTFIHQVLMAAISVWCLSCLVLLLKQSSETSIRVERASSWKPS